MMDSSLPIQLTNQSLIAKFKSGELSSYLIRHLNGAEKAAIFLIAVGSDTASRILTHMAQAELEPVLAAISNLNSVPKGLVMAVLDELEHHIATPNFKGGETYTTTLLKRTFGQRQSELLMQRLNLMRSSSPVSQLSQIPAEALVVLLKEESPQTIAVMMSGLGPKRAGELFALLSPELKRDISPRLAQLQEIQPELFHAIEDILLNKYRASKSDPNAKINVNGVKAIGNILAHSSPALSRHILRQVQAQSPELAEQMHQAMLTFDDMAHLTDRALQLVIQKAERRSLLYALKIASPEVQSKFFHNMSQRQAIQTKEEMQLLPPVRKSEALGCQKDVLALVRQLEQQGELSIHKTTDEQWID